MGSETRFTARLIADRYLLTGRLGHGGMSDVYLALDTRLDREVAVKMFRVGADDTGHHRFAEEARILARLEHPGLVTVHDAGSSEGDPFLVMRLVPGKTLAQRLADGPLPPPEVLDLARQLTRILAYVHSTELVHRDVKPSNVLLTEDGRAYLADFGISRLVTASEPVTATGKIMGTVGYLAPEQVLGVEATQAVDVYALGLVLLECLTGRREYDGAGVEGAIARLHRPPRVPDDVPAPLDTVIHAMTTTKSGQRPSMAECATLLEANPRSWRRARRRWAVIGAGVAGAAAVVGVSSALLTGSDQPATQSPAAPPTQDQGTEQAASPLTDDVGPPAEPVVPLAGAEGRPATDAELPTGGRPPVTTTLTVQGTAASANSAGHANATAGGPGGGKKNDGNHRH